MTLSIKCLGDVLGTNRLNNGIAVENCSLMHSSRRATRCLLWSEKRKHLLGRVGASIVVTIFCLVVAKSALAQGVPSAFQEIVPESSIQESGDIGVRAHTNVGIVVPLTSETVQTTAGPAGGMLGL